MMLKSKNTRIKNPYSMTDAAIAEVLGARIERYRLEQNKRQADIASEIGISRASYIDLVNGKGKLVNFIAALRVINQLEAVETLLPDPGISPIEQMKLQGKKRIRASRVVDPQNKTEESDW